MVGCLPSFRRQRRQTSNGIAPRRTGSRPRRSGARLQYPSRAGRVMHVQALREWRSGRLGPNGCIVAIHRPSMLPRRLVRRCLKVDPAGVLLVEATPQSLFRPPMAKAPQAQALLRRREGGRPDRKLVVALDRADSGGCKPGAGTIARLTCAPTPFKSDRMFDSPHWQLTQPVGQPEALVPNSLRPHRGRRHQDGKRVPLVRTR
jgi:hypothetical protein